MNSEIIAVGTELLLGQIVNTNAAFISKHLASLGIDVYRQSVVGDNKERLTAAAKEAFSRADLVIFTGGLGPTSDDITRETISELFGLELELKEGLMANLKSYFEKKHAIMPKSNIKQAMVPKGAKILKNKFGTAPGLIMEKGEKIAVLLPGPPRETEPMFLHELYPYLEKKTNERIYSKVLKFFGIGESALEIEISDIINSGGEVTVAPYIGKGDVTLRLTVKEKDETRAMEKIKPIADEIIKRLSEYFYGEDDDTLADAVCSLLKEKNMKIATVESCTGGAIGKAITSVAGASECFGYGFVTYANEAKENIVGVKRETLEKYGAVSAETAQEMASGALEKSNADIAISVTGLAGPGGGTAQKPVGLVYIGIAVNGVVAAYKNVFSGTREDIRTRAENTALNIARKYLKDA